VRICLGGVGGIFQVGRDGGKEETDQYYLEAFLYETLGLGGEGGVSGRRRREGLYILLSYQVFIDRIFTSTGN